MSNPSHAVIILTFDEEKHIGRCIKNAVNVAERVRVAPSK